MTLLEAKFLILILEIKGDTDDDIDVDISFDKLDESINVFLEGELEDFIKENIDNQINIDVLRNELEQKLNILLENPKINSNFLRKIFAHIADNQKIMAVKLCISELGHTLVKAKTFTEKLEKDFSNFLSVNAELSVSKLDNYTDEMLQTCATSNDETLTERIIALLRKNKKIEAIKLVKEAKRMRLRDAKAFVEMFNIRMD